VFANEEAEQIDEISASTLQSYVGKARDSKKAEMKNRTAAKNDMKKYGMSMDKKAHDDASRKVVNRGTGISVANKKLNTYPADKAKAKVMAREEADLDESTIDKNHPIAKEYFDLKKKNLKDLKDMITQRSKISDTSEFRSKEHAASHLIRRIHGDKKVDQVFGFNEEVELDEASDLRITKVYNKFPKKATYAVHSPDRKYYKEFDSMEKAKAHHAEKTGK
jgi:hypothetical protein